jgi:hypothetical protein
MLHTLPWLEPGVLGWLLSLLLALKLSLLTGDPKARADHVLGTFGSKSKSWLLEEGVLSALLWGCDGERLGPGPASRRDGTSSPRLCFWRVLHGLDLRAWCITNERTALSGLALVPLSEASMNMNFVSFSFLVDHFAAVSRVVIWLAG